MNNSLHRLIDGMVATLRAEVIPQVGTEFARGQAFGVIYMLNSIRLRAEWSVGFYREQLAAQLELSRALDALLPGQDAPRLPLDAESGADSAALEALRDTNEEHICALITWMTDQAERLGPARVAAMEAALHVYMERQLKHEMKTSAKPMFAEMSAGAE